MGDRHVYTLMDKEQKPGMHRRVPAFGGGLGRAGGRAINIQTRRKIDENNDLGSWGGYLGRIAVCGGWGHSLGWAVVYKDQGGRFRPRKKTL